MKHYIAFGIAYTVIFFMAALLPINAEATGPMIFFLAPGLTWIFVLTAIFLSPRLTNLLNKLIFVIALLLHYAITAIVVFTSWDDQFPLIQRMIGWGESWLLLIILGIYVCGQVVIWSSMLRNSRSMDALK